MFQFFEHDASPDGFYTIGWPLPRRPLDQLRVGVSETVLRHPKNVTEPPQSAAFDGDVEVAGNCGVSMSSSPAPLVESHHTFQLCGAEQPSLRGEEKHTGETSVVDLDLQGDRKVFHAPELI